MVNSSQNNREVFVKENKEHRIWTIKYKEVNTNFAKVDGQK